MRNLVILLLAALSLATPATARQFAERPIPVSPFSQIRVDGDFQIILTMDAHPGLKAEGDPTDVNAIDASVIGDKLTVTQRQRGIGETKPRGLVVLRISALTLSRIELNGASSLEGSKLTETDFTLSMSGPTSAALSAVDLVNFKIALQGPASVNVSGKAAVLDVQMLGPSTLDASTLEARSGKVSTGGPASVRLNHAGPFVVTAYGQSQIDMMGKGSCRRERGSSAAQVRGCDSI